MARKPLVHRLPDRNMVKLKVYLPPKVTCASYREGSKCIQHSIFFKSISTQTESDTSVFFVSASPASLAAAVATSQGQLLPSRLQTYTAKTISSRTRRTCLQSLPSGNVLHAHVRLVHAKTKHQKPTTQPLCLIESSAPPGNGKSHAFRS